MGMTTPSHVGIHTSQILSELLQTFSVKGQTANTFGLEGHTVTITTIQLCHCITKAATDVISNRCGHIPTDLYGH